MDFFAHRLLGWYDEHGRHDLPWQVADGYRRWLSEIMLQQTTVHTVIPYYQRFIARFPDIHSVALASQDEVLALWAGLGYYARGRHLWATAKIIVERYQGIFPRTLEALLALPGIGRSTAGAILAFTYDIRAPILDANVRRVLSRYHGVDARSALGRDQLWDLADSHTPDTRVADYSQAIMDLGALVCRRQPQCTACPLTVRCAFDGEIKVISSRPKPKRQTCFVVAHDGSGRVFLVRRPQTGIWGGLWSLPECVQAEDWAVALAAWDLVGDAENPWPIRRHTFTHFTLTITPVPVRVDPRYARSTAREDRMWYDLADQAPGVPAPVHRLLDHLRKTL